MLNFLQIRDYAIVDFLELEFADGFTCITGETGAGKSILVGALGLLCGNRADSSAVRSGAGRAELTAEFELNETSPALLWLRETELDQDNACLLRRLVNANGRSRAWINGTAVTLGQLAELGRRLVEIHGQNEHLLLVRPDEQFRLLDGGGHHDADRQHTRSCFYAWHSLEQEKQTLLQQTPLEPGELDLIAFQVGELENEALTAAEFVELEKEHRKLARGGELTDTLQSALDSLQEGEAAVAGQLYRIGSELDGHASLDDEIRTAASLLNEAAINSDEACNSIQSALSRIDLSPQRLRDLETRIGRQYDLARKHRTDPERLESSLATLRERMDQAGSLEKRLARIDGELEEALAAYRQAAQRLHGRREERAGELSRAVSKLMAELGMPGGRFEFVVTLVNDRLPTARGDDQIEINVSANSGSEPGPLSKVASGGELSRISLAVKIAARERSAAATQIFDEVDAGIGGETAHTVGALLKSLSSNGQALCVTHLAQVAVFANRQLRVLKTDGDGGTVIEARQLDETARVDEVARMLGGQLSERSRAHASELLIEAAETRH